MVENCFAQADYMANGRNPLKNVEFVRSATSFQTHLHISGIAPNAALICNLKAATKAELVGDANLELGLPIYLPGGLGWACYCRTRDKRTSCKGKILKEPQKENSTNLVHGPLERTRSKEKKSLHNEFRQLCWRQIIHQIHIMVRIGCLDKKYLPRLEYTVSGSFYNFC